MKGLTGLEIIGAAVLLVLAAISAGIVSNPLQSGVIVPPEGCQDTPVISQQSMQGSGYLYNCPPGSADESCAYEMSCLFANYEGTYWLPGTNQVLEQNIVRGMSGTMPAGESRYFGCRQVGGVGTTSGKITIARRMCSFTPPPQCQGEATIIFTPVSVTGTATISGSTGGLASCSSKAVYIRQSSCSGPILTSCSIGSSGSGCAFSFQSTQNTGSYGIYSCVDMNGDGAYTAAGEASLPRTLTVSLPPTTTTTSTTTTTTLLPAKIFIQQPAAGYYRTDQPVTVEVTTQKIAEFSFITASMTGKQVSSQVIGQKASFAFGTLPRSIDGYQLTVTGSGTSASALVIVRPVITVQASTPSGQQFTNEPVIACARVLDELGAEQGISEVTYVTGTARYDGETQVQQLGSPSFKGKGSLCPWEFGFQASKGGSIIFVLRAGRTGYIDGSAEVRVNIQSSGININFVDTDNAGKLGTEKLVTFETINSQGVRIAAQNSVTLRKPDGFTTVPVTVRQLNTGLYSFSFVPDQIEGWSVEITSNAAGIPEPGYATLVISVGKDPDKPSPVDPGDISIAPVAMIAAAAVIVLFLLLRR